MTKAQLSALKQAIRKRFPTAKVEAESVNGHGRYRIAIISRQFERMPQLKRQDALWSIVDKTLPREATLDISLILAFAPKELAIA
jgi:stress-induced morphogen